MKTSESIYKFFKISRYPYIWIMTGGQFFCGAYLASLFTNEIIPVALVILMLLWFMIFGNAFSCGINDAFDFESDRLNPRKRDIEITATPQEKSVFIKIALLSLLTFLPFTLILNQVALALFFVWVAGILLYNLPPVRFKRIPFVNVLGGPVYGVPVALMGYALVAGSLPDWSYITLGTLLAIYGLLVTGDALDFPFDKEAGWRTTGVILGSSRRVFMVALLVLTSAITYSIWLGLWPLVAIGSVFVLFNLYEIWLDRVETHRLQIFRNFYIVSSIFWFLLLNHYTLKIIGF